MDSNKISLIIKHQSINIIHNNQININNNSSNNNLFHNNKLISMINNKIYLIDHFTNKTIILLNNIIKTENFHNSLKKILFFKIMEIEF